jgi:transcriptional regulator with XRE-family HTH domain
MNAASARFGGAVRRRREALRWSQELLAERAQLNRSYLGEVERGEAVPTLATMDKLAAALGVAVAALLEPREPA